MSVCLFVFNYFDKAVWQMGDEDNFSSFNHYQRLYVSRQIWWFSPDQYIDVFFFTAASFSQSSSAIS